MNKQIGKYSMKSILARLLISYAQNIVHFTQSSFRRRYLYQYVGMIGDLGVGGGCGERIRK